MLQCLNAAAAAAHQTAAHPAANPGQQHQHQAAAAAAAARFPGAAYADALVAVLQKSLQALLLVPVGIPMLHMLLLLLRLLLPLLVAGWLLQLQLVPQLVYWHLQWPGAAENNTQRTQGIFLHVRAQGSKCFSYCLRHCMSKPPRCCPAELENELLNNHCCSGHFNWHKCLQYCQGALQSYHMLLFTWILLQHA
jgi:hypothetical protein